MPAPSAILGNPFGAAFKRFSIFLPLALAKGSYLSLVWVLHDPQ